MKVDLNKEEICMILAALYNQKREIIDFENLNSTAKQMDSHNYQKNANLRVKFEHLADKVF